MSSYVLPQSKVPTPTASSFTTISSTPKPVPPTITLQPDSIFLNDMDDESVSTLGNQTHHKWNASPLIQLALPLTQRPTLPFTPPEDASLGSISTLTTRLTTMEMQYNQISGAVQDIKTILAGLAQATHHSHKDKPPMNDGTAGRGSSSDWQRLVTTIHPSSSDVHCLDDEDTPTRHNDPTQHLSEPRGDSTEYVP